MPSDFVIPRGFSTLYRCSLTTLAQDKPYHEIPLIRDCCNHNGSCTLFKPYLIMAAGISSSSRFVRVSTRQLAVISLSKGILSTLNFHESIGTEETWTRNLSHPKRAPFLLRYYCYNRWASNILIMLDTRYTGFHHSKCSHSSQNVANELKATLWWRLPELRNTCTSNSSP